MATNLDIEPELLNSAVKAGKHPSKRAAVEAALVEYLNRRKQAEITKLFGEVEFHDEYDYKKARRVCR